MIELYGVSGTLRLREEFSLDKINTIIQSTVDIKNATSGVSSNSKKDEDNETEEDLDAIMEQALSGTPYSSYLHSNYTSEKHEN